MKSFFRSHTLIIIYSLVFFILVYGVFLATQTKFLGHLGIYYISLLIFYFGFYLVKKRIEIPGSLLRFKLPTFKLNPVYFVIASFVFILIHFILLGGSPTIKAMSLNTWQEVSKVRESLALPIHPFISYGSSIILKAVLPFFLLYFLIKKKKLWYWIVLIVGSFYVFSMMQKSFIVGFILPSAVYAFATRKFLMGIKHVLIMVFVVVGLSKIANPNVAQNDTEIIGDDNNIENVHVDSNSIDTSNYFDYSDYSDSSEFNFNTLVENADKTPSRLSVLVYGIQRRVFIVPGKIVSGWFEFIPKFKPFLYGDGYRLIANLKGKEHRSYASELYPLFNPKYAKQGFTGTANTASFMYDYANFGKWGLLISSFLLAFVFVLIEGMFQQDFKIKLSLHVYPVLFLSSTALTTLMFSGGWAFFILFYFLFLFRKKAD